HHLAGPGDHLVALADVVPLAPLSEVVSAGDLVLAVGLASLAAGLTRPRRRAVHTRRHVRRPSLFLGRAGRHRAGKRGRSAGDRTRPAGATRSSLGALVVVAGGPEPGRDPTAGRPPGAMDASGPQPGALVEPGEAEPGALVQLDQNEPGALVQPGGGGPGRGEPGVGSVSVPWRR
ncbi:MAG: hypothetical protein ACRD0J_17830, partial [Acidimicrobiales bacterium]